MNENKELCAKCGGMCCKNIPGAYSPEDLFDHEPTEEEIFNLVNTQPISIDKWDADEDSDYKDLYFLRPRILSEKTNISDNDFLHDLLKNVFFGIMYRGDPSGRVDYTFGGTGKCTYLEDDGCELEYNKRPIECRELIPVENRHCYIEGVEESKEKLHYAKKWEKYNKILSKVANRIINEVDNEIETEEE